MTSRPIAPLTDDPITNWGLDQTVMPVDMSNIGQYIKNAETAINALNAAFDSLMTYAGGTLTGAINEIAVTMASSSTMNIGAAAGNVINVTGGNTINGFDAVQAGTRRKLRFGSALTITYNAASMILPGGANLPVAAGDAAEFTSLGGNNWYCSDYQSAVFNYTPRFRQIYTVAGTHIFTAPYTGLYKITVIGGGGGGGGVTTGANYLSAAGGGGSGGCAIKYVFLTAGQQITVTVGAGGIGSANGSTSGTNGGTSSFGAYCSATGGQPGQTAAPVTSSATTSTGNDGGIGSGGDLNLRGGHGQSGMAAYATVPGGSIVGGSGGASYLSGGSYTAGAILGEGGAGATGIMADSNFAGNNGAPGVVLIEG